MKIYLSIIILCLCSFSIFSQTRNCGTMEHLEVLKSQDAMLEKRMKKNENKFQQTIKNLAKNSSSSVITIPVVVHVVYNNSSENISDAQVLSQINILNEDFRRNNSDASNTPSAFQSVAADSEIEFCLATIDPNGNSTTGITRTSTSQSSFSSNNDMKYSSAGGIDAWNTSDYMNIWVCDLGSSLLGYAQFPGGPISSDGVVCHYNYFGDIGTASYPYELGRTATHEVGHYLNLRHIWGDSNCGDDYCNDTPTQQGSNGGCPNFPTTSNCSGNGSNGDMFMNYMDYTYDACMNMFSQDQKTRMITAINQYRSGLLSSNGCQGFSYGCTNNSAYNYDPSATIDDGSCCLFAGCTDPTANNYNASACYDDGLCVFPVNGCTDPTANNFDPLATADDGSCCYGDQLVITITTDDYPAETSWQLVNQSGAVIQSIIAGDLTIANTTYTWNICPSSTECYDFIISDLYGDGMCCSYGNGSYNVTYNGSVVSSGGSFGFSETTSSIGSCITSVVGCMNSNASNYDPLANSSIAFGGILDPNIGTGAYFNNVQHLIFDSYVPSKIVSAVVYASVVNSITFELRDNNSNVIDDTTINVVLGGQRLYFDFDVPIGNDYQLGIAGINSGLYRNNGGVSYPYDIGGLLNITASSAGTGGYYYFYYDIEVEAICTGIVTPILGCTDAAAFNYDATANVDDGSCVAILLGCIDPLADNYYAQANTDDGTCVFLGCIDAAADNYDASANVDDGTCTYTFYGCTGPSYCNYDPLATMDDGSCAGMSGCMDPLYVEYSTAANCDDGSCVTLVASTCDAKPTGLNTYDITDTRFRLGWDNMNTASCMVLKYNVRYRVAATATSGAGNWTTKSAGAGNGQCNFGLNNVEKLMINFLPSTTYDLRLRVMYCSDANPATGWSAWTSSLQVTLADVCPDLANMAVQTFNGQQNKAKFTWDTTGVYEFARIYTRVNGGSAPYNWTIQGGFGIDYPTFSKNIFTFTPGETYRVQAASFCSDVMTSYKSGLTPPVIWTQPGGSAKIGNGTAINNLAIYPNPSRDMFNISFTSEEVQSLKVRILNVVGEELINEELQQFIGEYSKQIDLTKNSKGIYFIEIETNDGVINKKLILQ